MIVLVRNVVDSQISHVDLSVLGEFVLKGFSIHVFFRGRGRYIYEDSVSAYMLVERHLFEVKHGTAISKALSPCQYNY